MVIRTIHTDLGREGRKAIRSDLHTWSGGTPKPEVTWAQKSSLGREWLESHAGCPSRGDWPLGVLSVGLKTRGTKTSVVRNPDLSSEERAHTCLLSTRGRDSRLKLPANLARLLWLPPSLLWLCAEDASAGWGSVPSWRTWPLGLLLQQLWGLDPISTGVGVVTERQKWPGPPVTGSSPSSPAPASRQGDSGQQTLGKDTACARSQTHPSSWHAQTI